MPRDSASRKYQLTINNPLDHGFDHSHIVDLARQFSSLLYMCLCDETGEQETPHTHVYFVFEHAVMFSTLQKRFYGAHIEIAHGTNQENRDYVRKEGKWQDDAKHETNHIETFEEYGTMPPDRVKGQSDSEAILQLVKQGASDGDILAAYPSAMNRLDKIERARQTLRSEQYKDEFRKLTVEYIFGATGTGKTRSIMEQYGYSNVYRVTDYAHPFDGYKGQDVIIFEEFRSSLPISDMLVYLDGYPIDLPCRYANKVACFTKVYILTNIPLKQQYTNVQQEQPETWQAFLRRIHKVTEMKADGQKAALAPVVGWEEKLWKE